jgi:hypothetical protein
MRRVRKIESWAILGLAAILVVGEGSANAGPTEDAYVAGYATAVLERQLETTGSTVTVKDGVVTVEVRDLASSNREKIAAALSKIGGVVRVEIVAAPATPAAPPTAPAHPTTTPTPSGPAIEVEVPRRGIEFLPKGYLFAPLIADPRWPHFSISYQRFPDDPQLGNVIAVSLGETFSLLRINTLSAGAWELGLQAGVFSIFDLDGPSSDLINADYIVGIPVTYRLGNFSALARVFHQSSHLGDEFLLRNRVDRINLSYETVDLKLSYEVTKSLRIYGGGGYSFHREPRELAPGSAQYGVEVRSPWTLLDGRLRPLAALDVQHREENNWQTDLSLRVGIQFETLPFFDRKLQLMLEYFNGHSPNGQFYRDSIEYLGLGIHLYFF